RSEAHAQPARAAAAAAFQDAEERGGGGRRVSCRAAGREELAGDGLRGAADGLGRPRGDAGSVGLKELAAAPRGRGQGEGPGSSGGGGGYRHRARCVAGEGELADRRSGDAEGELALRQVGELVARYR